jgi:chromate transporter
MSPLAEVAALFTRLGFTAFGGPAAHIGIMHDEVVVKRKNAVLTLKLTPIKAE